MMRHGYAETTSYDYDDFSRALTPEGTRFAEKAAQGLLTIIPRIDLIVTSPLKRARQTAEIFGQAYKISPAEITSRPFLADGYVTQYFDKIRDLPGEIVLCVGHLPMVNQFVSQALPVMKNNRPFAPTTVAVLEFKQSVLPRKAVLRGYYTGEQLVMMKPEKPKRV